MFHDLKREDNHKIHMTPPTHFSRGLASQQPGTSRTLGKSSVGRGVTIGVPGVEPGRAAAAVAAASCC